MKIVDNITMLVGRTPLVKLNNISRGLEFPLLGKLEFFNPTSSVKDRTALAMVKDAENKGILTKETVVIESTSGNTGVSLAFICAQRGYRLILIMPENMSVERRRLFSLFGAELVLTPQEQGMKGAIERADQLKADISNAIILGQFSNPANPGVHRETTAREILRDTRFRVDIFVAGVGTGGTITGVGEVLKEHNPNTKVVAVEPQASAVLSGKPAGLHNIQGIGAGFIPEVLNRKIIDEVVAVTDKDAYDTAKMLARHEGILAGPSSGAAVWAGLYIANRPDNIGKRIVVLLPDSGERYLSTLG